MTQFSSFEQAGLDGGIDETGRQIPVVARTPSLGLPGISFYAVAEKGDEHPMEGSTYTLLTARADGTTTIFSGIPVQSPFETWK